MILEDLFFINEHDVISSNHVLLRNKRETHHISHVLRNKAGDRLALSNGKDTYYLVTIEQINKHEILCFIDGMKPIEECPVEITLCAALLKGPAYELLIEKAVELGIHQFQPLITEHCVADKEKLEKWQDIILTASKQSKELRLANLLPLKKPKDILWHHFDTVFVAEILDNSNRKISFTSINKRIAVCIGPEGGFSSKEIDFFQKENVQFIRLSDKRLRAETAALTALSILHYQLQN